MTHQMRHPPTFADDYANLLALRRKIADRIERDIALLDAISADPDLEPDADGEPSLGSLGSCGCTASQLHWATGADDEREMDAGDAGEPWHA